MNCNDFVEVEFSTYLVIRSWMNVTTENINTVKLSIAVNTDNLKVYQTQEPYGKIVNVEDPCDSTKQIAVDNIMLNVAKLDGYIGYYIGAEVLVNSANVSPGENDNPLAISNFATVDDICHLDNVDFLLLNPGEDAPTEIEVTVEDANLTNVGHNESYDYVYSIRGKFKITKKAEATP